MEPYLSIFARGAMVLIIATSPLVYVSFGMETLLYSTFLLLSLWLWDKNYQLPAILVAAALTWTRSDGVLLAITLCLIALWHNYQTHRVTTSVPTLHDIPWKLGLSYCAAIAPWYLFAWDYFGKPLPNTFAAKEDIFGGLNFINDGVNWWEIFYSNNPLSIIAFVLIAIGVWQAFARPKMRPLALWSILYTGGYTILNVSAFWYYTPLFVALVILAAIGGEWTVRQLLNRNTPQSIGIYGAFAIVILSAVFALDKAVEFGNPPKRVQTYRIVGQWINQNTHPDSTLLIGDLGIMGYYARRHTIDSPGLATPDMYFKLDSYAVLKYKPDYVVATQYYTWQDVVTQGWFHYHYFPIARFSTPDDPFSPMTVYQRRYTLDVPTTVITGYDLPLNCVVALNDGATIPPIVSARLLSEDGQILIQDQHPFLWNQYPERHTPNSETLREQIVLPLTVPPGTYYWELTCDRVYRATVEVLPIDRSVYSPPETVQWSNFVDFFGVELPEGNEIWSGGTLTVSIYWQALQPADQDYSIFLHLVDQNGVVVAQDDGYPRHNTYPTTAWHRNETIVDIRTIDIPLNLPNGDYGLVLGWYNWRTAERLLTNHNQDALPLPITITNHAPVP
jgi:hypothetical protein